jgi:ribosomal protein S18 acetylase RimI-like enzyme
MEHGLGCDPGARRVYAYHAFTRPQYRGRHLHSIVVARALEVFRPEGVDELVAVVDATNLGSLKSHARLGAEDIGACYALCAAGRTFTRLDASVARRGVRVAAVPDDAPTLVGRAGEASRRAA